MAYTKQSWVDNSTPVDKSHMDHIEDGLVLADGNATTALGRALPTPVVNGQWVKGVGGAAVWSALSAYSATPPGSPQDGDLWCFPADATNGVMWMFRYNAGSASAYKWEFVGGPPLSSFVGPSESTSSGSSVDLATVGPSVTVPRSGDYLGNSALVFQSGNAQFGTGDVMKNGVSMGFLTIATVPAAGYQTAAASWSAPYVAGDVVKLMYRTGASLAGNFSQRFLGFTPKRVS